MVQMSMVKRTKKAKMNASIAVLAMKIAKDKQDVQWKKANKYKKLFMAAKKAVLAKYGVKAKQEWMKKQASSQKLDAQMQDK